MKKKTALFGALARMEWGVVGINTVPFFFLACSRISSPCVAAPYFRNSVRA